MAPLLLPSLPSFLCLLMLAKTDPLTRLSMACPALPMCGLAITESERRLPSYIDRFRAMLER